MDQNVEILPTHVRLWTNKRHPIHVCICKYIGRNLPYDISTALYKYSIMFPQIAAVSKGLIYFVYSTQLMVGYIPKGMLAKHYIYDIHNTPVDQQPEDGHSTAKTHNSGLCRQKQASRAWIRNYILQNTVGCNFYPCHRYLLLAPKSSIQCGDISICISIVKMRAIAISDKA